MGSENKEDFPECWCLCTGKKIMLSGIVGKEQLSGNYSLKQGLGVF